MMEQPLVVREAVGGPDDGDVMCAPFSDPDLSPLTTRDGERYHLMRWKGRDRYVLEPIAYAMSSQWPPHYGEESD